jgi:nucleotide-binding universal stress UspA family protein
VNKILVPTDFSEHSNYAIEYASYIAKEKGGQLIILHISKDREDSKLAKKREELVNYKYLKGIAFKIEIVEGKSVSKSINRFGEENDIDLIVMGSNGVSNVGEMLLGSNTENVIRNSQFNVLTIKYQMIGLSIKSILFPSDFSPESYSVFETVLEYAELFNAEIHLLRVVTSAHKKGSTKIDSKMDSFISHFQLKENSFKKVIYRDRTKELGVLNYSIDNDIDLITIGSHGKGIVRKILKESISQDLVRDTFKPILTVRFF